MGFVDRAKLVRNKLVHTTMGKRVVFHHVPKCGGTSVARALRMKYLLSQVTIKPEASYRALAAFTNRDDVEQLMVDVLDLREQMLLYWLYEDVRCVSAHVRFSPIAYSQFADKYKFITILRDPVDRFISNYFWIAGKPEEHPFLDGDFESFLATPRARRMGASYVEYYCGLDKSADLISKKSIDAALANLDKFDIVGRLDRLPEFERQIKDVLGVRLKIGHENKMRQPRSVKRKMITPELREKAQELCAPDLVVWNFVKDKFYGDND
jgi:hypothetical protein